MKHLIFTLLTCLCLAFLSCQPQPNYQDPDAYQPQATEGTYNGQPVMYVTDNRGEQYMMQLILFNELFNSGGYNSVSSYYYNHSNDYAHIYPYSSSSFHYVRPYGGFYSSYHTGYMSHRIYAPSATIIHNSTMIRTSHYGGAYTHNIRTTTYHANGAVTHSTYHTTYHPSGRVTSSSYHSTYHPSSGSSYHSSYHSSFHSSHR